MLSYATVLFFLGQKTHLTDPHQGLESKAVWRFFRRIGRKMCWWVLLFEFWLSLPVLLSTPSPDFEMWITVMSLTVWQMALHSYLEIREIFHFKVWTLFSWIFISGVWWTKLRSNMASTECWISYLHSATVSPFRNYPVLEILPAEINLREKKAHLDGRAAVSHALWTGRMDSEIALWSRKKLGGRSCQNIYWYSPVLPQI